MSSEPFFSDDANDWIIPIHGIEAPAKDTTSRSVPDDESLTSHLFADDELPSIEFRPRLRRSA